VLLKVFYVLTCRILGLIVVVGAENLCHLCRCPLDAGDSVPCPVRGWQVLASPDVR
jgi:hypothetical protein